MTNTNKRYIFIALSIAVVLLILMLQFAFMFKNNNVYADYNEVINNSNLVVNFNQLFNNTISRGNYNTITISKNNTTYSVNGYFTGYSLNLAFNETSPSISILAYHVYYLDYKLNVSSGSTPNLRVFNTSGGVLSIGNNAQMLRPSVDATVSVGFQVLPGQNSSSNPYNFSVTPMLIDLTQMFGSGNEPTLVQAKQIFVADYYYYNSGTALAFSQLSAYAQGVQSVLGSNVELSTEFIINNANPFTLPYNLYSGKIYYNYADYDPNNGSDALITDGLYFLNGAFVPLGTTLSSGTNISIKYDYESSLNDDNIKCNIYSINSKNELSLITIVENDFSSGNINYVITSDCIGIVFNVDTNNNYRWSFSGLTISYPMNNYEQVIQDAYQNGYNSAKSYYEVYYGVGGIGYQSIYNLGYYAYPSDDHFTFQKLIYSVIDVPVQAITNLFDFDILGVNMKTFYLSLFTLAVIVTILRLVL